MIDSSNIKIHSDENILKEQIKILLRNIQILQAKIKLLEYNQKASKNISFEIHFKDE